MIIGIDVGGTNIDGVVIENGKIIKKIKNPVDRQNLFSTIHTALTELIEDLDKSQIERINLSTTISTNAIVEGKIDDVLVVIQSGPGIQNEFSNNYKYLEEVSGYVDHRGKVVKELDLKEIKKIKDNPKYKNLNSLAIVTKFSTRNPESEIKIKDTLESNFKNISVGHLLSGNLNYPRRVNTAYLNSSVSSIFSDFLDNIKIALNEKGIDSPIYILKADGGTMDFNDAYKFPLQSVLSGPAASFMGISALENTKTDSIYLDIGGTTTDIFFLADGIPLFEPTGIEIDNRKTLVRSIFSHSIGLGGDSVIKIIDGKLKIGTERLDKPMALGGKYPTVTDAMKVLDLVEFGDGDKSFDGLVNLALEIDLEVKEFSQLVLQKCSDIIYDTVIKLLNRINSKPLFTVREVLEGRKLEPKEIKIIGGPAKTLSPYLKNKFEIDVKVPENFLIANAIGAALSKPTFEINLHADTVSQILSVPEENIYKSISRNFDLDEGRDLVIEILKNKSKLVNDEISEVEIVEENSFNMVDGWSYGKNIRIKGQIMPGLMYKMRSDNFES